MRVRVPIATDATWHRTPARFLFARQQRAVRPADEIITAFRDGRVMPRSLRRTEGFTNAVQEIGYQGIRKGDLVIHSMDGFAGAIGVAEADGKASPVVHAYRPQRSAEPRYYAYLLRVLARQGFVGALAKGIRERSTAFDSETFRGLVLPEPAPRQQRAIADYLDVETARIDALIASKERLSTLIDERLGAARCSLLSGCGDMTPFRHVVRYREGPGIMAADFRESGTPLLRIAGLQDGRVTLAGCNYVDDTMVAARWRQFRVRVGDYILSGSATMGSVSVVEDSEVEGAIPYTGLIILRPAEAGVHMPYVAHFLKSDLFMRQIDQMKTGMGLQHFGPSHLSEVRLPLPDFGGQVRLAERLTARERQAARARAKLREQLQLLREHRDALIAAAVTGELEIPGVA